MSPDGEHANIPGVRTFQEMGRRSVTALLLLVLAGAFAFVVIDGPFGPGMSSGQAARALEHQLSGTRSAYALGLSHTITDHYTCSTPTGAPVPGEPDWTYDCVDATNSQGSGFFVLIKGHKIAKIQPSG